MAHRDHLAILKLLKLTEEAVAAKNEESAGRTADNLGRALKKHFARERMIQYPVSDRFIKREEWDLMLIKIYGQKLTKYEK